MPLTMKDIAQMIGVSESTVSRAINGKPGVGKQTREKILALVEKHNFQPNTLASGLASSRTRTLGLILPNLNQPALVQIMRGVERKASELGYHLILANTGGCHQKEVSYLTLFQKNRVEGIIFLGGALAEEEILKLGLNQYPLVLVNKLLEELALPTMLIDHQKGAEMAIEHLVGLGHERVGLIIGSLDHLINLQLWTGYQEGLERAGLNFDHSLVIEVEDARQGGYHGLLQLLQSESVPTAILVTGDLLAVGVVEAIKQGGYFIPTDFAVVAYGESLITEIIDPLLTTVKLPLDQLGQGAVNQLVKVIRKEEIEEPFVVLTPELIRREST